MAIKIDFDVPSKSKNTIFISQNNALFWEINTGNLIKTGTSRQHTLYNCGTSKVTIQKNICQIF